MGIEKVITDIGGTHVPKSWVYDTLINEDFAKYGAEWYMRVRGLSKDAAETRLSEALARLNSKDKSFTPEDLHESDLVNTEGALQGRYGVPVFDGSKETLEYIAQHIPIVTFSNGGTNGQREQMKMAGLDKYLTSYFSTIEIGNKKKPESYIKLCNMLGVQPNNVLYLNDDVDEAKAALSAGLGRQILVGQKSKVIDNESVIHVYDQRQALQYLKQNNCFR